MALNLRKTALKQVFNNLGIYFQLQLKINDIFKCEKTLIYLITLQLIQQTLKILMRLSLNLSNKKSCQKLINQYFTKSKIKASVSSKHESKRKQQINPLLNTIKPSLKAKSSLIKNKMITQTRESYMHKLKNNFKSRYIKQQNQQLLKSLQIVKSQIKLQTKKDRQSYFSRKKILSLEYLKKNPEAKLQMKENILIYQDKCQKTQRKNSFCKTYKTKKQQNKQFNWNSTYQIPSSQRFLTQTSERPKTSNLLKSNEYNKGYYQFQKLKKVVTRFNSNKDLQRNPNQRLEEILNGWQVNAPDEFS